MEHILLLPFLACGHLLPMMALAKLLARKKGYMVTLITTPLNLQTLKSSLSSQQAHIPNLRFASLPFHNADDGLPSNVENADSIPHHLKIRFITVVDSLQPAFERLVSDICREHGRLPLCIVTDLLMGWSVETARNLGIFHCFFFTSGACSSYMLHFAVEKAGLRQSANLPKGRFLRSLIMAAGKDAAGPKAPSSQIDLTRFNLLNEKSEGMLINTVEGLEKEAMEEIKKIWKRVWAIGPVQSAQFSTLVRTESCIEWLDQQPRNSVLYVSFGSENSIHPQAMMELAKGLEDSGMRFIWAIRPPTGFDMKEEFRAEWLPEGFEHRMTEKKQGLLIRKWAPQLEILKHRSTGAFLSHCGWNSTLESLSHGVPVVGWPIAVDQFLDSKLLEDLDVGVEIARGSEAEISCAEIARVIRMAMDRDSEKGKEMRRKAKAIESVMKAAVVDEEQSGCKGPSVRAIEDFLQTATLWRDGH